MRQRSAVHLICARRELRSQVISFLCPHFGGQQSSKSVTKGLGWSSLLPSRHQVPLESTRCRSRLPTPKSPSAASSVDLKQLGSLLLAQKRDSLLPSSHFTAERIDQRAAQPPRSCRTDPDKTGEDLHASSTSHLHYITHISRVVDALPLMAAPRYPQLEDLQLAQ